MPSPRLTFLGAAQTVTGSRHLLTTASGKRVLVDAGLFQGRKELRERNWIKHEEFPYTTIATLQYDSGNYEAATARAKELFGYDELNRQQTVKDALNHVTTQEYDLADNVIRGIDAMGKVTTFSYDNLNRQTDVEQPAGDGWSKVYDEAGNVTSETDGMGQTLDHEYDGLNRRVKTTDERGGVTTMLYDLVGNRTDLIDPEGNGTSFTYDAQDRLVEEKDPLGKTLTHVYDAGSRLTTQIVRRPWKHRIVNDLDGGFGIQMFAHLAKKAAVHGRTHISETVDYVRKGRKNNFD